MTERTYIHGTSAREQQRLIEQTANLELQPGERLLEIGCGVGAAGAAARRHDPPDRDRLRQP